MQSSLAFESASLPASTMGVLEIDTKAIVQNYKQLQSLLPQAMCGAVLKADAYGFGLPIIAPFLKQVGCQHFFVAHLDEALALRACVKEESIYVFSGLLPGTESLFVENNLIPVLNDFRSLESWSHHAQNKGKKLSSVLHFDTGMQRSGFDNQDLLQLFNTQEILSPLNLNFVMSHLVNSQENENPLNTHQKNLFERLLTQLPQVKSSLADTGGIYLGQHFHYDIARPGKGLFGLYTPPKNHPPLHSCVKLLGKILQIRSARKGETVGYNATHTLTRPSQLATLGIGFADGYKRHLSNKTYVEIQGFKAPVLGQISMDYTVIDITDIPEPLCYVGGWAELINSTLSLDTLAHKAGTISRELSTGFGNRLYRLYC